MIPSSDPAAFILGNTAIETTPLVPEIKLYLASEIVPIWQLTEEELQEKGLPPPFWAFAWAGGQALSRYILDNPDVVIGKRVLDFAAGSGIVAVAAMMAGAASCEVNDVDAFSCAASSLNAKTNGVTVSINENDLVGTPNGGWDVVLAGDICYEQPLAGQVEAWLKRLARDGALVLIGDPGRTYLPKEGLEQLAHYAVPTTRELEDLDVRNTSVWQVQP